MNNEKKKRRIPPAVIILVLLPLLIIFLGFWTVMLIAPWIAALYLLLRKRDSKTTETVTAPKQPIEPPQPETELSIIQKSFGLLQRRITENVELYYPNAKWVWGVPSAFENFRKNEPLVILLNGAGGYSRAWVITANLTFKGLNYVTSEIESVSPEIPDENGKIDQSDDTDETPVNYGRLAFEWADAHIFDVNAKYNEAIAQNQTELLIPAEDLPHPDSWTDVCGELKRSGFSAAELREDGIAVQINAINAERN